MTALNKQALREVANAANIASWGKWESYKPHKGARGYEVKAGAKAVAQHCLKVDSAFIAAANPPTVLALLDELEAAKRHIAELESFISQSCYVFDGRDADISDSYIDASTSSLMPKVSTKNEGEPCRYCSDGSYSGLPGGACEHCMGTGLDNPAAGIGVKGE